MNLEQLPVLNLDGPPLERGRIHGETMRKPISELVGGWVRLLERLTEEPIQAVAESFLAETSFLQAIRRYTPDIELELQGMAEGAGLSFEVLTMFNCTDENQWYLEHKLAGSALPQAEGRGCSSFGSLTESGCFIGQNMDIPGSTEGYQVLLHKTHKDRQEMLFSLAGMVGMIGMSSAPLGVVNNSMKQLRQRTDGLPVNMVVCGLLQQPDLESARQFIKSIPHATGHNYIVGDAHNFAMFECSANQVLEIEQGPRCIHTNHPLENNDLLEDVAATDNRSSSNTHDRYREMETLADSLVEIEQMKAALASHADADNPICRHQVDKKSSFSAGSVIYELTGTPRFTLAPGPPCETDFGSWTF